MNNALLHAMNKTRTFVEVESGSFISLPKDGTDKPPVNADINNNIDTFHSTGGEGTPTNPIPIINIAEWNKTSCEKNLFNKNQIANLALLETGTIVSGGNYRGYYFSCKPNTLYSAKRVTPNTSRFCIVFTETIPDNNVSFFNPNPKNIATNQLNQDVVIYSTSTATSKYCFVYFSNQSGDMPDTMICEGNIQPYIPYIGNTYPYRLEDTDDNLHYGGDLPDGTADTYNRETGELTKRTKSIVLDGTEDNAYWIESDQLNDYLRVRIGGFTDAVTDSSGSQGTLLCSHFINGPARTTLDLFECVSIYEGTLYFKIAKSRLTGYSAELGDGAKAALLRTYLGEQYNAGTPVVVQYKLITPETYQIKQYGKTYGGVVWEYNEKPKSIQYHTNIFTDKNIDIQCEVRKLGNRKMSEFYWVTENGDKIITEDGDYIMFEY